MAALKPTFGSGSTDGNLISVTATATPGTTLHTAITGTNHIDEVYVYVCNIHTDEMPITLEIDGVAAANRIIYTVPYNDGMHMVLPGIRMQNGGTIAAFAGTPSAAGTTAVLNCMVVVNTLIDPETAS